MLFPACQVFILSEKKEEHFYQDENADPFVC